MFVTNVKPIEQLLEEYKDFSGKITWNQDPNALYEPVKYIMLQDGKKMRPLALNIVSQLNHSVDSRFNYTAAYALELFHNFTLMHDDIMDDADLRRGHDTVYKKFGANNAILSGDAMMILSLEMLYEVEQELGVRGIVKSFTKAAREICEGQSEDMQFENQETVTQKEYLEMIRKKTAVLVACSMEIGAIISGFDLSKQKIFYKIGELIGIAFQIQDDYLDTYGDISLVGKKSNGDIIQRKKNALYINAMEIANIEDQAMLKQLYNIENDSSERIPQVLQLFEKYNLKQILKQQISSFKTQLDGYIMSLGLSDTASKMIEQFISLLENRRN